MRCSQVLPNSDKSVLGGRASSAVKSFGEGSNPLEQFHCCEVVAQERSCFGRQQRQVSERYRQRFAFAAAGMKSNGFSLQYQRLVGSGVRFVDLLEQLSCFIDVNARPSEVAQVN
jgi:hypothetical protein